MRGFEEHEFDWAMNSLNASTTGEAGTRVGRVARWYLRSGGTP